VSLWENVKTKIIGRQTQVCTI